nr:hypothetical protein [uncultured Moraxella sp.]
MNEHRSHVLRNYRDVKYDDKIYNCLHFAVDVYKDFANQDISHLLNELMTSKNHRTINPDKLKHFKKLDEPTSPCIAVMHGMIAHAGVFIDGFVLHLTESGVHIMPPHLLKLQYSVVNYYAVDSRKKPF